QVAAANQHWKWEQWKREEQIELGICSRLSWDGGGGRTGPTWQGLSRSRGLSGTSDIGTTINGGQAAVDDTGDERSTRRGKDHDRHKHCDVAGSAWGFSSGNRLRPSEAVRA